MVGCPLKFILALSLFEIQEIPAQIHLPEFRIFQSRRRRRRPPAMASPSLLEGEWEVCNDSGFVYKRRKRDSSAATHTVVPPAPSAYPAEESQLRKEPRKKALLKLKDKYSREIEQWEQLVQMLRMTREKAESSIVDCRQIEPSGAELRPRPALQDSACNVLIDDLLFQVEAQESIIQDLDGLCATAEAICDAHEESIKQSVFGLPVWGDPLSIMKDLSVLNADNVQLEWSLWKELSHQGEIWSGLSPAGGWCKMGLVS